MKLDKSSARMSVVLAFLNFQTKNWQTRRSQRLDKQELLSLQANLKMEVQAKQHMNEELNRIKMEKLSADR